MLILKLTSPEGETRYVTGAFPSACGKTNLAMLIPTLEGWKVETVGDDICWMKFGADGRLYAINPEAGFFGVAPGHQHPHQPQRHPDPRRQLHLHQHRADRRRRHLVGGHDRGAPGPPDGLEGRGLDARQGHHRPPTPTPASRRRPAQDPAIAPEWEDPKGVPISAILFGGRRASVVPLVFQSHDWEHGVFLGSIMASETTAAQAGAVGNLRRDPFAMLPFCGYNMADYFAHWLRIGAEAPDRDALPEDLLRQLVPQGRRRQVPLARLRRELPRARVDLQPRHRQGRRPSTRRSASVPTLDAIDIDGLDVTPEHMEELLRVDTEGWRAEVPLIREYYAQFGDRLPAALAEQVDTLEQRLG